VITSRLGTCWQTFSSLLLNYCPVARFSSCVVDLSSILKGAGLKDKLTCSWLALQSCKCIYPSKRSVYFCLLCSSDLINFFSAEPIVSASLPPTLWLSSPYTEFYVAFFFKFQRETSWICIVLLSPLWQICWSCSSKFIELVLLSDRSGTAKDCCFGGLTTFLCFLDFAPTFFSSQMALALVGLSSQARQLKNYPDLITCSLPSTYPMLNCLHCWAYISILVDCCHWLSIHCSIIHTNFCSSIGIIYASDKADSGGRESWG